jgi:D-alanine-D-alanine ligase
MKIGFVYDLKDDYLALGYAKEAVAEFDSVTTIDGVGAALLSLGCDVVRVGRGHELARRLVAGERFDLVFSIAEGLKGRSREAQVPALCELFDQPYAFSDPLVMAATLDKGVAKRLVRDAGVRTAAFAVLACAEEARTVDVGFPAFVKPLAEGTGKGCAGRSRVESSAELEREAGRLIEAFRQPVIVETYLPGREFTVGIVGEGAAAEIIAVLELIVGQAYDGGVYGFTNKQDFGPHLSIRLADDAEARAAGERALAAYRALGCRDVGRVDMRSDARGEPQFLEVNPIPGLSPGFSDLPVLTEMSGRSYAWLIRRIVAEAAGRYGLAVPEARTAEAA